MNELVRRKAVSFDAFYFEKQREHGNQFTMQETFNHITKMNLWGSDESVSGVGSTDIETKNLKLKLIQLIHDFKINTILDAPCGDFNWLSSVDLPVEQYIGVDIVSKHIECLKNQYINSKYQFMIADICVDALPKTDLIICRDCFVHFSFQDIYKAMRNFKKSGATYLLTTIFTNGSENSDIVTGDWRTLNLELSPFNFSKPVTVITEGCLQNDGLYQDKSLALWKLEDLILNYE